MPVVGNFAGPKAIRAVGKYLKARGAIVSAFYVSNVEQYLTREGGLEEFCASASTLPLDDREHVHQERARRASRPRGGGVPHAGGRRRRLWRQLQLTAAQHAAI